MRSAPPPSTASSCGRSTRQARAALCTATRLRVRRRRPRAWSAARSCLARPGQVDQRAAELELSSKPTAALEREIERRKPNNGVAQLVRREVRCLLEQLLDIEAVLLQSLCCL